MDIESLREYCLRKPGVSEGFPFGEDVLVFKVCGKMFALFPLDAVPMRANLKCDPDEAVRLRETYPAVLPGYHMNKDHWNTIMLDGSLPPSKVLAWIDDSYALVSESLPKNIRATLKP